MGDPAGTWVEHWLSAPRFDVYLAAAGDRAAALALYDWNAEVSAALLRDLGHLEVGLRNAYDRALTSLDPPGGPHWAFDPWRHFPYLEIKARNGRPVDANYRQREHLERALKSARRGARGKDPVPGKVIAEIPFGFWQHLTDRIRHVPLWERCLHTAFRPGTGRPAVDRPVTRLHTVRNRVAHYEPLLAEDLPSRYRDILAVAELLSVPLRDHIDGRSTTLELVAQRPTG